MEVQEIVRLVWQRARSYKLYIGCAAAIIIVGWIVVSVLMPGTPNNPTVEKSWISTMHPVMLGVLAAAIIVAVTATIGAFTGGFKEAIKVTKFMLVICMGVMVVYLLLGPRMPEVMASFWNRNAEAIINPSNDQEGSGDNQGRIETPEWEDQTSNGDLPVGVWSKTYPIAPGKSTEYDAGNCIAYKVRFSIYGGDWVEHKCDGSYLPADAIQFMVLKKGIKKVPFVIK